MDDQKLEAGDQKMVEQAALTMQAILASKENSADIVTMAASGPDGMANVVMMALAMIEQRGPIAPDDAPVIALTAFMTLVDFLVKVKKFEPNEQAMRASLAAVMDLVAQKYGASDEDLAELDQMMPGLSQEIAARRGQQGQQQAPAGMMGAQPGMQPQPPQV